VSSASEGPCWKKKDRAWKGRETKNNTGEGQNGDAMPALVMLKIGEEKRSQEIDGAASGRCHSEGSLRRRKTVKINTEIKLKEGLGEEDYHRNRENRKVRTEARAGPEGRVVHPEKDFLKRKLLRFYEETRR